MVALFGECCKMEMETDFEELISCDLMNNKSQDFVRWKMVYIQEGVRCLLYTSPSPRDQRGSRMPSSA